MRKNMDCHPVFCFTVPCPLICFGSLKLLSVLWFAHAMKICGAVSLSSVTGGFLSDIRGLGHDYVLVTPVEVDSSGAYISHDVVGGSRRRRSLQSAGDSLHYRLSALGRDMHLDLRPSKVMADGFMVQTFGESGITTLSPQPAFHGCFYHGFIRNHSSSSAALSTCEGLSGLIRTSEEEFFISPLPKHLAAEHNYSAAAGHHPHMLYKRSADHHIHGNRASSDTWNPISPSQQPQPERPQQQHFCGRRKKYAPKPPLEDQLGMPDEPVLPGRGRRSPIPSSTVGSLNVETLVVADRKMIEKHGRENVTTYILTVMNMVSSLFKDGTIGTDINIVVVSLLLLEQDPLGLSINHHADQSLNSFCHWQSGLMGKSGKRHDHAILLTGLDICSWKNEPCDTLGFAPISGMCNKYRSCTINEDTGLGLAFTIAHESGHNFGMIHDGEGNPCRRSEGNIMSPTLAGNNGVFSWSACSRQYLNRFLNTAQASCLVDEPGHIGQFKYPEQLPGQLYDADTQCKWQFGSKAKLCDLESLKDICKSLWCHRVGQRCETKFMPAAEGTACGSNMWCRRGQCVGPGDHGPRAVHGQWSEWSKWSACSRSCGGGVMTRDRSCNRPRPQYDGKFCQGSSRTHQLCNAKACPPGTPDFRAQQCAEYNSKPFRGWYYKWTPYRKVEAEDVCKLYCIAEDFAFFFAMASKVKDGTPCSDVGTDVCVEGQCEPVGCDKVLGSKATSDACGVCKGNNSTCKFYKGRYLQQHRTSAYYPLVTLPAGARSVRLQMLEVSSSSLAVRNLKRKYYLTGRWSVGKPGKFSFAGTVFEHQHSFNRPESLQALGPTNETLVFELFLVGRNPGVQWEYALPRGDKKRSYSWSLVRSQCSAQCAGGRISTKAVCVLDQRTQVNASLCSHLKKPAVGSQMCNTHPCPAHWAPGEWGPCSRSCGGGQQTRAVRCVRRVSYQRQEEAEFTLCPTPTPARTRECHTQECPPQWSSGTWSECSKSCGRGLRKRGVFCRSAGKGAESVVLLDSMCDSQHKPKAQESCVIRRCPRNPQLQWIATPWGQCSVSCGRGVQKRELRCGERSPRGGYTDFPLRRCRNLLKPALVLQQACSAGSCPPPRPAAAAPLGWYTSPWQQCSVSCGGGVQVRSIQCLRGGRPTAGCQLSQRPISTRACNTQFCPAPSPAAREDQTCLDSFRWCHQVSRHGLCNNKIYGLQCCKSCSRQMW